MTSIEDRTRDAQADLYNACWNHVARILTPEQQVRLDQIEREPIGHAARKATYRKLNGRKVTR